MLLTKMVDRIHWMKEKHPRAREAHSLLYLLAHIFLVAVNGTITTGGFLFAKRTSLQSLERVILQFLAFVAQLHAG